MSEWPYGLTLRPIERWPSEHTKSRRRSNFSATLGATLKALAAELAHVRGRQVVLEIALEEGDFRQDGMPRARAIPAHPGIILAMETPDGPLSFPCDTFDKWQDNLRAVVLTMEKLRAIDRYGVTKRGEQYTGWRQIEGARPMPAGFDSHADVDRFLLTVINEPTGEGLGWALMLRRAKAAAHPDRGGDAETFQRVIDAERWLKDHDAFGL